MGITPLLPLALLQLFSVHAFPLDPQGCNDRKALSVLFAGPRGEESAQSRRDLFTNAAGLALTSLALASPVRAETPQTLVVTGANSGIGYEACKRLVMQGHRVVMACRTIDKATAAASSLSGYGGTVFPAECNLASMASIKAFSESLPSLINGKIDCLCLNAGVSRNTAATDVARTADGFELTVGTNHFGHFYLNALLLPLMQPQDGRVVVTASGVHDPESPGGAQGLPASLGDLSGLVNDGRKCEMLDGGPFNADKAYKDSKLCNVLFTRELQRRLEANMETRGISANCFNPGLIVSTGLFRDQNQVFTKLFDLAATDLLKVGENPPWGGGALAYMTDVKTRGQYCSSAPGSSKYGDKAYGNQFKIDVVSKEARDDAKAKLLWDLSAKELGLAA